MSCANGIWSCEVIPSISVMETAAIVTFVAFLFLLRFLSRNQARATGENVKVLDLNQLNSATVFKEVFMGYLGAGMLEPLLAIAGDEDPSTKSLLLNGCQLLGLFWWTHLLTDAFDTSDVVQSFTYRKMESADDKPKWLKLSNSKTENARIQTSLDGSLSRDMALWFMLTCIFAAFCGIVTHVDVIHSWAVFMLWVVLHHISHHSTAWTGGYFGTLLSPSATLMPLEYCLNLADSGLVEDIEGLTEWRDFIRNQCGIELMIKS